VSKFKKALLSDGFGLVSLPKELLHQRLDKDAYKVGVLKR
jgi:hypothetical protein